MRKSNINKIQNPQRSQRTRPKKSKTVSVLHVPRFTHTTRQQNQNPQKSLSRLDLLLSFHRNKPKVELSMPCVLTCLSFFPARANLLVKKLMGILLKTSKDGLKTSLSPLRFTNSQQNIKVSATPTVSASDHLM